MTLFANFSIFSQQARSAEEPRLLSGFRYKEIVEHAGPDEKGIPLIVALHWSGSTPEEFAPYITGFKKPVRVLLLEGQYAHPRGGYSFYVRTPRNYYEMSADEKMEHLLREGEKLSKFIEDATDLYSPKKKPIIIGASQGGDLSYFIGIRYGLLISHSFPLLATIDGRIVKTPKNQFPRAAPIDSYHGTDDPIVSIKTARQHINLLNASKYKARLHSYIGVKHDISDRMKADYMKRISRTLF